MTGCLLWVSNTFAGAPLLRAGDIYVGQFHRMTSTQQDADGNLNNAPACTLKINSASDEPSNTQDMYFYNVTLTDPTFAGSLESVGSSQSASDGSLKQNSSIELVNGPTLQFDPESGHLLRYIQTTGFDGYSCEFASGVSQ